MTAIADPEDKVVFRREDTSETEAPDLRNALLPRLS